MDSLVKLIEVLGRTARRYWLAVQCLAPNDPVTSRDVKDNLKIQQRAKDVCSILSATHRTLSSDWKSWALLLPLPEEVKSWDCTNDTIWKVHELGLQYLLPTMNYLCPIMNDDQLTIDLLYTELAFDRYESRKISATYLFNSGMDSSSDFDKRVLQASRKTADQRPKAQLRENMRSLFAMIVSRPNWKEQLRLRRGTLLDLSRVALCITVWVVTVWSSDWVRDLCNCGIRQAKFERGKVRISRAQDFFS